MNPEEPKQPAEPLLDERWLDEALERYSAASPRAGLENRILANLEAHAAQQRQRRWIFALAASAVVVLFAILIANTRNVKQGGPIDIAVRDVPPSQTAPTNAGKNPASQSEKTSVGLVRAPRHGNRTGSQTMVQIADVKQEQFPAERPLSEQERLLQIYLSRTPAQELQLIAGWQQSPSGIDIPELDVQPIEIEKGTSQ